VPVALSPDSTLLATGSLNGVIRLWYPSDLTTPAIGLRGHEDGLFALIFYDNGKHLASSGRDGTIRLWNLDELTAPPVVLESGLGLPSSLDVDTFGRRMVVSGQGGLRVLQLDAPHLPLVLTSGRRFYKTVFSPNGKRLASGGTSSRYLRLWDLEPSGRPLVLTGHSGAPISLAFSLDGKRLASGGGAADSTIRLWRWMS
jgi:WD40 repeat protein